MDTFENNEFEQQPDVPQSEPVEQPHTPPQEEQGAYHSAGTGRRESPFADSPYVNQAHREYEYQPQYQPPQKPRKEKSGSSAGKRILSIVLVISLVAAGCGITAASVNAAWRKNIARMQSSFDQQIDTLQKQLDRLPVSGSSETRQPLADGEYLTPGQVYAQNMSSVVSITSTIQAPSIYGTTTGSSSGSGFIISSDGYVVTNHHVIENATDIEVTAYDGTTYPAKLVGQDVTNDLAVLKIEAQNLPTVVIGKSDSLAIGDMVVAIGNPLGKLQYTQTVGYVSGINRQVSTSSTNINMIQTDAAINPGNSGGPLFNMRGEVVGITTAKYSSTASSGASIEGLGFAIPIDDVMGAVSQLIDNGYISSGYMNISVQDIDEASAAKYNLPTGAYVYSVNAGGAAEKAGIQAKDIITDVGGHAVKNTADLNRALRNFKAGDTTTVTVIRSGSTLTLEITLEEKPRETTSPTPDQQVPMPSNGDYNEWYEFFRRYFEK